VYNDAANSQLYGNCAVCLCATGDVWLDKVTDEEVLRREDKDRQILKYLAKEISMDWPCFETRQTFV